MLCSITIWTHFSFKFLLQPETLSPANHFLEAWKHSHGLAWAGTKTVFRHFSIFRPSRSLNCTTSNAEDTETPRDKEEIPKVENEVLASLSALSFQGSL